LIPSQNSFSVKLPNKCKELKPSAKEQQRLDITKKSVSKTGDAKNTKVKNHNDVSDVENSILNVTQKEEEEVTQENSSQSISNSTTVAMVSPDAIPPIGDTVKVDDLDSILKEASNITDALPTNAGHLRKDTMQEIRRQLLAMREEQDFFGESFEESIAALQTEHENYIQKQSLLDLKDAQLLKDEELHNLEKSKSNFVNDHNEKEKKNENEKNENEKKNENENENDDSSDNSSCSELETDDENEHEHEHHHKHERQGSVVFKNDVDDDCN